jgi:hypothetical protein
MNVIKMNVIDRVSLQDQIAEVKRELEQRKTVYDRLLRKGKIGPDEAEERVLRMNAVLATLEALRARERMQDQHD